MRVLVLGGSRFVGAWLVDELVNAGHKVTVFNRGQTPAILPPEVERLYGDRQDHSQVREVLEGREYEVIYDVSGYTLPETSVMVDIFKGRISHYIYISSAAVYERRWYAPVTEDFSYSDVEGGDYGRNKASTEHFLLKSHQEVGFPASIVRPWMVFGPGNPSFAREQLFFRRAELDRTMILPFNGFLHMQYGHVQDLARALVLMAGNPRCFGEAYNITGPEAITMNGYLQLISELTGRALNVLYLTFSEAKEATASKRDLLPFPWQYSRIASIQKAMDHFGFWPQYSSKLCTEDTYQWYKNDGAADLEHDFTFEDALISRHANDFSRLGVIAPNGDMPQVV